MTEKPEDLQHKYDKTEWTRGPWDNEPDRVDFIHAGFSCFALRNNHGNWCGYVGIPESHPEFGKDYNDIDVNVHGGITYAEQCAPPICHIPQPGMPEKVYWLGFDTAHLGDLSPLRALQWRHPSDDVYRDLAYTRAEIESLAEQLKKME